MRTISLHDTWTGRVRPLVPARAPHVRIYACGPTVYGRVHVGNARPFVVFSLLKRFLVSQGYDVEFVANITDINDKIYAAARQADTGSTALAREMTAAYVADTDALGLGRPDREPLASETIGPIVALIERLIGDGHAYEASGDVYFSVRTYPAYGELSHRDIEQMDQGEGVQGAERKRDPLDFALWKARKDDEDAFWDSPWGPGRPGWHIECSAMAEEILGLGFEIHGGGNDLLFPHHENEAAQSAAAHGEPLAQLWVHNGMVRMADDKMSKSVGNVFVLHEALAQYGRDALLMYLCGAHYRQPVEFDAERLTEAAARCARIRSAARALVPGPSPEWSAPLAERFFAALAADFNTPGALAAAFDWVREANRRLGEPIGDADLRAMLDVLGLANLADRELVSAPAQAWELLQDRERARAERDFVRADAIRDELRALGWEVRDGPDGPALLPGG
ncbi:MAG: cysteine--tRNA ligase [Actinomycetota bacterium]|nr:cysteine--tRNA ligase [Actinomycetota bacterium]